MGKLLRYAAILLVAPLLSFAQPSANKADISGVIVGPQGFPVPDAEIRIRNLATGVTRNLRSDESGKYLAIALDPGTYVVTSEAPGFAEARVENVALTVGSSFVINIHLPVQSTSTAVAASETVMSHVQVQPSMTVDTTAIADLPINGRRFQDFAQLAPSVQVTSSTRNQLSFSGQRGINSNIMLDGGDYNQPFYGGIRGGERSNTIITIPQSAIKEFQVVTTGYTAEYGRSTGGLMNAVTQSGANDLHGQAFFQLRPHQVSMDNPIPQNLPTGRQKVAPSETLYQYGGAAGGAIQRNRLFWFGALERQNASNPRYVLFPSLTDFTPTANSQPAYDYYKSLEGRFDQTNRATALTGKIDWNRDNGDRVTFKYNFSASSEANAVTGGGDISPFSINALSQEGTEKDRIHLGSLQYTKLFGPSTVNDLRFSASEEQRPRLANSQSPTVSTGGLIGGFGAANFLPAFQQDRRWQMSDAFSLTKGRHTAKLGFDYSFVNASQLFGQNQYGSFSLNGGSLEQQLSLMSAVGVDRFNANFVTYSHQIGNMQAAFNMHQIAFFAQDQWRIHRQFLIDFGVRYETQINPQPDSSNTDLVSRIQGFQFPLGMRVDPTVIRNSTNQWMPRAGFAWTPFENRLRTVVRGHAGIFYASTPMVLFADPVTNFRTNPGNVSLLLTSTANGTIYDAFRAAGLDLNTVSLSNLPVIPIETVQRASAFLLGGTADDPLRGASVATMANDFRNPRSYQAGLGFDTEVRRNLIVGLQANYIHTVYLERNRDYNVPAPIVIEGDQSLRPNFGIRNEFLRPAVPRPIPTLGSVTVRESSAKQLYRAVTGKVQYRTKRLQFQGFYTLSENLSDDDNERNTIGNSFENAFNFQPEYNYSDLDTRHQFTGNAVYSLPWGFELGALYRYRTGFPMNARTSNDDNQDTMFNDRPYAGPGIPFQRNSFRNRGFQTFDLRVMKSIHFGERLRVQFSAEMFNVLNSANVIFSGQGTIYGRGFLPSGSTQPIDPRFQQLELADGEYYATTTSQVGKPFQVQFGARVFF